MPAARGPAHELHERMRTLMAQVHYVIPRDVRAVQVVEEHAVSADRSQRKVVPELQTGVRRTSQTHRWENIRAP